MIPTEISNFYQMRKAHSKWSPLKLKPTAWYKGDGDAQDSSGNGYHGTWVGTPAYADGVAGQGMRFNGVTNTIRCHGIALSPSAFTCCLWVNQTTRQGSDSQVFSINNTVGGAELLLLYFRSAPTYPLAIYSPTIFRGDARDTSQTIVIGTWYHIAVSCTGTSVTIYVNGVNVYYATDVNDVDMSNVIVSMASRGGSTNNFTGTQDDIMLFNRALTQLEISELYLNTIKQGGQPWGTKNPQPMWEQWTPMVLSPTAWYKGDGNALDSSGNGYDGTSGCTYSVGRIGQSFNINTIAQRVLVAAPLDIGVGGRTISVWLKTIKASGYMGVVGKHEIDGLNGRYGIYCSSGKLIVNAQQDVELSLNSATSISNGAWRHVVATYDRVGDAVLYIDGVRDCSKSMSSFIGKNIVSPAGLKFTIGSYGGSFPFEGTIDDVLIFNYVLTQSEITDIYVNSLKQVGHEWGPYMGFSLTVESSTNSSFILPTTGNLNNVDNDYAWWVNWGDGKVTQEIGKGNRSGGSGIYHAYPEANTEYQIKIQPLNPKALGYLGAFGFFTATTGSGLQANRNKVRVVDGQLTEQMIRVSATDTYECSYWFYNCKGMRQMGSMFNLPQNITNNGNNGNFAVSMFEGCSHPLFNMNAVFTMPQNFVSASMALGGRIFALCNGASFTMGASFNIPQKITGSWYSICEWFSGCSGVAFNMNAVFTFPQSMTSVGPNLGYDLFAGCSGASFTMNAVFNLPQNITNSSQWFARSIFRDCSGPAFKMNSVMRLPQGITTTGNSLAVLTFKGCSGAAFTSGAIQFFGANVLTQAQVSVAEVFTSTFQGCTNLTEMISPATIPQLAVIPSVAKNTFTGCTAANLTNCYTEWGGAFNISTNYTKVEYLESTSTAMYLDTGYQHTLDSVYTHTFRRSGSDALLFGQNVTGTPMYTYLGGTYVSYKFGAEAEVIRGGPTNSMTETYSITLNKAGCTVTVNGTAYTSAKVCTAVISGNVQIFRANNNFWGNHKCMNFQASVGGVLKINLIPVVRKADNVAGMFDTVTQTLFTNQGTGVFTVGPPI